MPFTPVYMKDAQVTINSLEFAAEVSSAAITPANTSATWKGLTPTSRHNAIGTDWTVDLAVGQDYDTAASLSRLLLESAGTTVAVIIAPKDGGQAYTVNAVLAPVSIGGAVEAFAEGSVSLPCDAPAPV